MRYIPILLIVAGCMTHTVTLKHPDGRVAQCGPYRSTGIGALSDSEREARCIRDFKEQGFLRV